MFNASWRKLVASALQFYFLYDGDEISLDNQDMLAALLEDLYTLEEVVENMEKRTIYSLQAPINETTTSSVFEPVVNSGIFHTFTHPNAHVRCLNVAGSNNTAGQWVYFRVAVQDADDGDIEESAIQGTTLRTIAVSGIFANIPTGSPKAVSLQFRRSANTGQFWLSSKLVYEIVEWPDAV